MKRALGKFESAATITDDNFPWNLVGIARLDALPATQTLRLALNHLQERHPFLRLRLVKENGTYSFESEDVPPIPLEMIDREHEGQWLEVVEFAVNNRIDRAQGPLAHCIFLGGQLGPGEIIIIFHHAIVDGASVGNMFHELLFTCAAIETGGPGVKTEPLSPKPPVEKQFPPAYKGASLGWKTARYLLRQMREELQYRMGTREARQPPIDEQAQGRILHLRIPAALTAALVRRTRKERVTLNSALHAAMLLSVHSGLYHGEKVLLRYMSMVNLRPYLKPPIGPEEMGCCISMLRFTTAMAPDREFWSLAREINDRIYRASKSGEKFIASTMSERLMRMTFGFRNFRMSTTALSFTGPSLVDTSYGPFRVRGLHGFISNFGLGPEYTAHVSLFNDELFWDILYLDTDLDRQEAQGIADQILAILQRAGAPISANDSDGESKARPG